MKRLYALILSFPLLFGSCGQEGLDDEFQIGAEYNGKTIIEHVPTYPSKKYRSNGYTDKSYILYGVECNKADNLVDTFRCLVKPDAFFFRRKDLAGTWSIYNKALPPSNPEDTRTEQSLEP